VQHNSVRLGSTLGGIGSPGLGPLPGHATPAAAGQLYDDQHTFMPPSSSPLLDDEAPAIAPLVSPSPLSGDERCQLLPGTSWPWQSDNCASGLPRRHQSRHDPSTLAGASLFSGASRTRAPQLPTMTDRSTYPEQAPANHARLRLPPRGVLAQTSPLQQDARAAVSSKFGNSRPRPVHVPRGAGIADAATPAPAAHDDDFAQASGANIRAQVTGPQGVHLGLENCDAVGWKVSSSGAGNRAHVLTLDCQHAGAGGLKRPSPFAAFAKPASQGTQPRKRQKAFTGALNAKQGSKRGRR
jgi:hypothetical protein